MAQPKAQELLVNVIGPDGESGTVPAQYASSMPEGWRPETPEETRKRVLEQHYGGTAGEVISAGAGFLRGATMGQSDIALTAPGKLGAGVSGAIIQPQFNAMRNLASSIGGPNVEKFLNQVKGPVNRETLAAYKEVSPSASTAGEVAGVVAPAIISGGKTLLARGASMSAPGVLGTLGRATEQAVAGAVGKAGQGLARQALNAAISKGAGSAVEGAFMALGQVQTEEALSGLEAAPEKVAAHVGLGALLGFGVAAPIGAGAEVSKAVLKKAAALAMEQIASPTLREGVESFAREKAVKGLFAVPSKFQKLLDRGRAGEVGDDLLKPSQYLDDGAPILSGNLKNTAERIAKVRDAVGKRKGELIKKFDELARSVQPEAKAGATAVARAGRRQQAAGISPQNIADRIEKELLQDIAENPALSGEAASLKRLADSYRSMKGPITFEKADTFKRQLQKKMKAIWQRSDPSYADQMKARSEGILNSEIDRQAKVVAEKTGNSGLYDEFIESKRLFGSMAEAGKLAEDGLKRQAKNRAISLTDYISGGALGAGGAAAFGPAGMALGAAGAAANKVMRENGDIWAAKVANRIAKLSWLERSTADVDRQIATAIDRYITGTAPQKVALPASVELLEKLSAVDKSVSGEYSSDKPTRAIQRIQRIAANPEKLGQRVAEQLSGVESSAPIISGGLSMQTVGDVQWLASKSPKQPEYHGLSPHLARWVAPRHEVDKWKRYVAALDNPLSVIADLKAGRLTPEAVEALRERRPKLYEQIRSQIQQRAAEMKEDMPYGQRVMLSMLFQTALDSSMTPEAIASTQSMFAENGGQPPGAGMKIKIPAGKSVVAMQLQTETEKMYQGG